MPTSESSSVVDAELPTHLTGFIGRDRELDELSRLLMATRLLTLTGAGGSGKTRLAREATLRAAPEFERVVWVDLAPISEPPLLVPQVAADLRAPNRVEAAPLEWVVAAIGDARVLLVLDNCEHLVDACAELADSLLRACPRLTLLATSREALGVASETAWLVPPLTCDEGARLFVERARSALPSLCVTPANEVAICEICRRLDGIPLAIELAAARTRVLTPEQIAARLDDAFRLLTSGSRTALPRHRTLRATMDWSHDLLSAREQTLLRRLTVFAGSFSLSAAESVCAAHDLDADDILDGISTLLDKSLILMESGDGEARYRVLETVRQYGRERLASSGEVARLEERHARYYLEVIEAAAPSLVGGSNAPSVLTKIRAERDNLRTACSWAVAEDARAEVALRLVGAMYWLWYALGQFREAREFADRALALRADILPLYRARGLVSSALTAIAQGEYGHAQQQFEEALPLLRDGGNGREYASSLAKYGASLLLGGEVDRGIEVLDEALVLTRDAPAQDIAGIFGRFWRAWAACARGELQLARKLLETNIAAARGHELPTTLAHGLIALARVEIASGDCDRARELATEGFEIEVAINDAWGVGIGIDVVALIAVQRGRLEDAARLLGAVESHRRRIVIALPGIAAADREGLLGHMRAALGARAQALYAEGTALGLPDAIRLAFAELTRDTTEHGAVPEIGHYASARHGPDTEARRLRIHALGPLQVFVGDRVIEAGAWTSARPRELLVYLAMHPEGRTKEQVGLAFWPDASHAQLRNNFHVTLHRLRKALGSPEWVTLAGERYRIEPDMLSEFDARDFERDVVHAQQALRRGEAGAVQRLEETLALFRGDFLDGEPAGDWHLEYRERFQRLCVDGLMALGAHLAREGRHQRAAEAYRRVLTRDELHGEAVQALIRCHAELGERPQALRVFRRFAERLREELGVEPDASMVELARRLQEGTASEPSLTMNS